MTAGQNPATAGKNRARQGQWLFRQGGLVLGPLLTEQIIEKLYSGTLDGNTEIAPIGQTHYRPLAQLDVFKVDLAKAQAKLRVDAIVQADRAKRARKRNLRVAIVATAAAIGGRRLARLPAFERRPQPSAGACAAAGQVKARSVASRARRRRSGRGWTANRGVRSHRNQRGRRFAAKDALPMRRRRSGQAPRLGN